MGEFIITIVPSLFNVGCKEVVKVAQNRGENQSYENEENNKMEDRSASGSAGDIADRLRNPADGI